jgi:hypothetical protein
MLSSIYRKTEKDISHTTMLTDDVASDDYMVARGFVEMTPRESRYYRRFFDCAHRRTATADRHHLAAFLLRARRLFREDT